MTAAEYRTALKEKLTNLIEKEGNDEAIRVIASALYPLRVNLDPEWGDWEIADNVMWRLIFEASPEEVGPASAEDAQEAVADQPNLSLAAFLEVGLRY